GDLFASSGNLTGFQLRGLQLIGDVNGAALRTNPSAGNTMRDISVADCLITGWHYGGWYLSGTVMYSELVDSRIAGNGAASPGAAGVYADAGTLAFDVIDCDISTYPTLIRSACDGIVVSRGALENCSGDAIYNTGGSMTGGGVWFD